MDLQDLQKSFMAAKNETSNSLTANNNEDDDEQYKRYVTFHLGGEEYAIDIILVIEIIRMIKITPVPLSYDFVLGVINLRGNVVPVIDLNKKFDIPRQGEKKDNRIIVLEIDKKYIGFQVDQVNEVVNLPESSIDPTPSLVAGFSKQYINGVGKIDERIVVLLDIKKLLSEEELERISQL